MKEKTSITVDAEMLQYAREEARRKRESLSKFMDDLIYVDWCLKNNKTIGTPMPAQPATKDATKDGAKC